MSQRVHHARLVAARPIARDTQEYVFAHDEDLRFRPGQFISVQVGTDDDQNPVLRSYSLASAPERAGEIVLVLRLVEGGLGSGFFADLRPGDPLRFTGPMGFFVNELAHPGDVVYAATGTGIAPIVPMAEETLRRDETGKVLLFWGVRRQEDLFWGPVFKELAQNPRLTYRRYLSRPDPEDPAPHGRIVAPVLEELPTLVKPTFYLCGNGQMLDELKAALVARGIDRKRQIPHRGLLQLTAPPPALLSSGARRCRPRRPRRCRRDRPRRCP